MYGLIGKIIAVPGSRDELAQLLMRSVPETNGCLSYVVADDAEDPQAIWVTEIWESRDAHDESLNDPKVQQAIADGRALVASMPMRFETSPRGGRGPGMPPQQEASRGD